MMKNDMLNYALKYAKKFGWAVFPCNGKVPLTPHGFKDATKDEKIITEYWTKWPNANIAVATGKVSGIFVVDIDIKNGREGDISLAELEKEFGKLPDTVESITPSGGRHIFFKYPKRRIGCKTDMRPGIDIRGDGGYVIVPPSIINDNLYEWEVEHLPSFLN